MPSRHPTSSISLEQEAETHERSRVDKQGVFNIAHPSGEDLIAQMLDLVLKQDDPERSFVEFKKGDEIVLLLNNQGGMSTLEMGAILDETLNQLGTNTTCHNMVSGPPIRHLCFRADYQKNKTSIPSES